MRRYLERPIKEFLSKKIVLLMGPRQVGKTTLAKGLTENCAYYNYDIRKDLAVFRDQEWDRSRDLVIFDELHKMKKWKLWLKGLYDEGLLRKQKILVTGSARLDIAKKMGDSLAGRFFSFRMYPLDLGELQGKGSNEDNYTRLLRVSGFPEPFFEGSERFYRIWRKTHSDLILRQDLLSLEQVRDLDGLEMLVELLASRVGSTISINALSEDLGRDDKTIKRWLEILENLYIVFKVSPKSSNMARGIKKSSKYFFYDTARVEGDEGAKFENLVALSLKKHLDFLSDTEGMSSSLHFLRNKDKQEIDFFIERKGRKAILIEAKVSDGAASKNFAPFKKHFMRSRQIQLVRNLDRQYSSSAGVEVLPALDFLANLDLSLDPD